MADDKTAALPDGTDTVIEGGAKMDTTLVAEKEIPAPRGDAERPVSGSGSPETGLADRFRSGREKLSSQAGEKARGLVTQGMERTAEALANVSKMVGDTARGSRSGSAPSMATMRAAPPVRSRMPPIPLPRKTRTS